MTIQVLFILLLYLPLPGRKQRK